MSSAPVMAPAHTTWLDHALCRAEGWDVDIFYPVRGNSSITVALALSICARCPVVEPCRDYSLTLGSHEQGIYGGMTATGRALFLGRRRH